MGDNMVTIPVEEYKKLLKNTVTVEIFSKFVSGSKYSIDRKDCGMFFGFEVKDARED